MSERTELIKARREAEDNTVKTVIQLSTTLLVLMAGYVTQANVSLGGHARWMLPVVVILLLIALVAALAEQRFSSKAYQAQLEMVERYYTKQIREFSEPSANTIVRRLQLTAFVTFVMSLVTVGMLAVYQAEVKFNDRTETAVPVS